MNTGNATVVFLVRSANPADPVRNYTVEPGKYLAGTWNVASFYGLKVYGPNGFVRYFHGSIGSNAAALDVRSRYRIECDDWNNPDSGRRALIGWKVTNVAAHDAEVSVLDAYTGNNLLTALLQPNDTFEDELSLDQFYGWYDLIITVAGDPAFKYRLAGHVETGKDSYSDPVLGGLSLKG